MSNRLVKSLAILALCVGAAAPHSVGLETQGAFPVAVDAENAGWLSWDGYLEEGVPKEVEIVVVDASYVMDAATNPSVRFVLQMDDRDCWGDAIQGTSRTWQGRGGLFEEMQVPVGRQGGSWKGSVTIVPCSAIRYLCVCLQRHVNHPFFGLEVDVVRSSRAGPLSSPPDLAEARAIHEAAWREAVADARKNPYAKYGLYASRSLAVRHPEVYLQADALFLNCVTNQPGFGRAFEEVNPHSDKFFPTTFFDGPAFRLTQVELTEFESMTTAERYGQDAPVLGFLDRRVLSLASTLKAKHRTITEIERCAMAYFSHHERRQGRVFLVYCTDETCYLAVDGDLFDAEGARVGMEALSGVILILNEESVWYPLFGRDDSASDPHLRDLVSVLDGRLGEPSMTAFEASLVVDLKAVTTLGDERSLKMARLAAVKGSPWSDPFGGLCDSLSTGFPSDVWIFAVEQHWVRRANYISPHTAWLAAVAKGQADQKEGVSRLVAEWQGRLEMVHGHVWQCNLVRYTIDESILIGAVHCVLHANALSSVLDLAEIENVIIMGSPSPPGNPTMSHTYVSLYGLGLVLSNGEIAERDGVINSSGSLTWSALWYVSRREQWAFPYIGCYTGTWAPSDVAELFGSISVRYSDEFYGFECRGSDGSGRFERTLSTRTGFLSLLTLEIPSWKPFSHP